MNKQILDKLHELHPDKSVDEIKEVISQHLNYLNRRLKVNTPIKLTIPHLGTVHTHGNAKDKSKVRHRKIVKKHVRRFLMFTDSQLLF